MSRKKLRIQNTDTNNLISNLRGEIGEIITSWVLYKDVVVEARKHSSKDAFANLNNPNLNRLYILSDRLSDDIVARLSELAEEKIGRLNFYFASVKIGALTEEVGDFITYIQGNRFDEKRNIDISHKELPEKWSDHKQLSIHIRPIIILRGIAKSLRLMKSFDSLYLGPSSVYLWRELSKKRYEPTSPPKIGYILLPYLRLSKDTRIKVALEEIRTGFSDWDDLQTEVNYRKMTIKVSKKWGIVILNGKYIALDKYPLITLKSITFDFDD